MESSKKIRHVIPVSGGKDSAAMCVLLHKELPDAEYVFCDTGSELRETYTYLDKIEKTLGIKIIRLGQDAPFDDLLEKRKNYLPSPRARWCTVEMKIKPFEKHCGKVDPITSYVGIRYDEAKRKGYFNTRFPNIQPAYPFIDRKIDLQGVKNLLEDSGLGMPTYYRWRTRSGCYFCFFQRRIEWVNLSEEHPDLFEKACAYEEKSGYNKEGRKFTWIKGKTLRELIKDKEAIKERHERKMAREKMKNNQLTLEDVLDKESSERCDTCHI